MRSIKVEAHAPGEARGRAPAGTPLTERGGGGGERGDPPVTSSSALNRRSFLARSAAVAVVPAVATLAGKALAQPASADALPDYAPIPPGFDLQIHP